MDNFRIIYRILRILEKAMDCEEFDRHMISAEALGLSEARRTAILKMLAENGYVQGLDISKGLQGDVTISMRRPEITLKGLEYLEENSLMKKAAALAKGIKDIVPGI